MKRSLYIFSIFIICLILLGSCATSKNIDTQKQIDYSDHFNRIQSTMESLRLDVSKQIQTTTDKLSNLKLENKTVYLSPPDSTGKQYTVKESNTTVSKEEQVRQEINETFTLTVQQLVNRIDSLSNKVSALINEKTKQVELSWWDLHKDKVYGSIIGLLLLLFLLYKVKKTP